MKIQKLLISFGLLAILTSAAFAQQRMSGTVVDVTDGKTVVMELGTKNKVTAQLDYIEIPEPEQQLSQTVKDHLRNLLLGKNVEFFAREVLKTKFVGKMFLGDVDVSQQMLRDGAAWYAILDEGRQNPAERENYKIVESQAKLEKRGVWGIENLKTAWEFRAEKEKAKVDAVRQSTVVSDEEETEKTVKVSTPKPQPKAAASTTIWADVSGSNEKKYLGIDGLFSAYLDEKKIGFIYTGSTFLDAKMGKSVDKIEFRTLYAYQGNQATVERDMYILAFLADSKNYQFINSNNLTITANGAKFPIGKAVRLYRPSPNGVQELLMYKINRKSLEKINKSGSVKVQIGGVSGVINQDSKGLIEKLMNVSN